MFPEAENQNLATTITNVGWSPVVTAVLTRVTGEKAMAGFGKVNGVVVKAWMVVMWGAGG